MLDIILYDKRIDNFNIYISVIDNALSNYNINYVIHKYSSYDNNIVKNDNSKRIYIINTNIGTTCIDKIRKNDLEGIIILISNRNKCQFCKLDNHYLILDIINLDNDKIRNSLLLAIDILYKKMIFSFKYNSTVYRIPFDIINYIEKENSVKRCIIHTIDRDYYIVDSITNILNSLSICFIRTHQSCIVNMNNISKIDLGMNEITFMNGKITNLLNNRAKKEIRNYFKI